MSEDWSVDIVKNQIVEELNTYKLNMLKKPIEDVYESSYEINVHETLADFIFYSADDFEWEWLEKYRDNLLDYFCRNFMKTSYDLMNDDMRDFVYDLIEEEKRLMVYEIKNELYKKIYNEYSQFQYSFRDLTPMEVYSQAEKIVFFSEMFDYIADKDFYYDSIIAIKDNDNLLESLYEFAHSQYYGFDKNDYEKLLSNYINHIEEENEQDEEMEQE